MNHSMKLYYFEFLLFIKMHSKTMMLNLPDHSFFLKDLNCSKIHLQDFYFPFHQFNFLYYYFILANHFFHWKKWNNMDFSLFHFIDHYYFHSYFLHSHYLSFRLSSLNQILNCFLHLKSNYFSFLKNFYFPY